MSLRGLGAILFGVLVTAVGLAAPASAILAPGRRVLHVPAGRPPQARWTMQSICIQPNGTRAQPDYTDETIQTLGCDVIMGSDTPSLLTREEHLVNFAGRADLTGDLWTFQITQDEGLACPDGSTAPTTETYAFTAPDRAGPNLTGTHTSIHGAVCGLQPA